MRLSNVLCRGISYDQTPASQSNLANYGNAGGRIFANHYAYNWFYNAAPFSSMANWAVKQTSPTGPQTAIVNRSFAKGAQLTLVGASTTLGQIAINVPRRDLNGVVAPTQFWLSINQSPAQLTFDMPVGAAPANQCGRVLFNGYGKQLHYRYDVPGRVHRGNSDDPARKAAGIRALRPHRRTIGHRGTKPGFVRHRISDIERLSGKPGIASACMKPEDKRSSFPRRCRRG